MQKLPFFFRARMIEGLKSPSVNLRPDYKDWVLVSDGFDSMQDGSIIIHHSQDGSFEYVPGLCLNPGNVILEIVESKSPQNLISIFAQGS